MMKKSLCVSKNNKQPSNKLSLSSSATTTIFSAGIKVAITSLFVIVFSAPINEAAVIQAVIEIDGSPEDFVKIILQKMDHLIEAKKNAANQVHNSSDTITHYDIASSTLMSIGSEAFSIGRTFTIRGNVTDNKKNSKPVIRFQLYAEATNRTIERTGIRPFDDSMDDEDDNNNYNLCSKIKEDEYHSDYEQDDYYYYASNGGILEPIVKTVEPFVLTLLNIIFHGIMTSIISKIMDNANMSGDVRLV